MHIGRRDQEMYGQAGTSAEQGMDAIAAQEWTRMVCGRVTGGGIRIASAPGQDGSTINNEIASPDQMATHGTADGEDEEGLKGRGSGGLPAFAKLRRPRTARFPRWIERQATGEGQSWPTLQPVMHILIGESP